jgi:N6-L-threonylcarbamoyladenine synthase
VHISGGTTELLLCKKDEKGYETEIVGKTLDVSAGQLIDRIGVMGCEQFPAGRHMDAAAKKGEIKLPVSVKGADINFSGAETVAKRIITEENKHSVYYAVFECIAKSLCKSIENAMKENGAKSVLMVGGVSSNSVIRSILTDKFKNCLQFCEPAYSTDGAVGNAFLAEKRWNFGERS